MERNNNWIGNTWANRPFHRRARPEETKKALVDLLETLDEIEDDVQREKSPCCRADVHLVDDIARVCAACRSVVE